MMESYIIPPLPVNSTHGSPGGDVLIWGFRSNPLATCLCQELATIAGGCHSKGLAQRMMGPGKHHHLGRLAPTPYFSVSLSFRGALLPRPQKLPPAPILQLLLSPQHTPHPLPLGDKVGLGEADSISNLLLFTQSGKTIPASRPTPLLWWSIGIPWPSCATPMSPTPPESSGM